VPAATTTTTPTGLLVGGVWSTTGASLDVTNPARPDELVGTVAAASADDVRAACAAAEAAGPAWRATPGPERGRILHEAANLLAQRRPALAEQLTREEGKTLPEAAGEVDRAIAFLRYYATAAVEAVGGVYPSAVGERLLYTVREPLGVVAAITPWNFPIAIPAWQVAPALAFGNTVVLKPSEVAPLSAVAFAAALQDAGLPAGVLNVVCGDPAVVGPALTDDEAIRGITFTGSRAVGKQIQHRVLDRGVKVQLELGGQNPVIVLDDADLDQAVDQAVRGAMGSSGQKCTATSRIIVTPGIHERFVEAFLTRVAALTVGDPLTAGVDLGPLASKRQRDGFLGELARAGEAGQHAVVGGGTPAGDGWFVEPTVFLDPDPQSRLAQEEIFGPVTAIMPADDLEAAIGIANGVRYGLAAAVFTRDIGQALRFVRGIEAGLVHVNSETPGTEPQVPFGGMKDSSSHSREQGTAAVEFFTATKTVYLDVPPEPRGPGRPDE
jgi:acyl-CoA reductase-like NAD-dependent aldehyde dehydrogenase